MPRIFFGYGSKPELARETLHAAAESVTATGLARGISWEDLTVSGRVIIDRVLETIDDVDLAAFDVSTLNENVLFELGYAIARGKRIWLLLDKTDSKAKTSWRQFRLLSGVAYEGWANSADIKEAFIHAQPHLSQSTLYDDLIEPNLMPGSEGSLFYLPSFHATEASRKLGLRLDAEAHRGIRLMSADQTESAINSLAWYAQKVCETDGTVAHLVAGRREMAWLHNARIALVAGMAEGFEHPLLMLAEEDYTSPLDYRDRLKVYNSSNQCREYANQWLAGLELEPNVRFGGRRLRQITQLRGLRFGEHVAENEADVLADYFVETAAFDDVVSNRNMVFVGRKGAGKTANMLQAAARLSEDARNLVVVIKPQSYEMEALVALLADLDINVKSYAVVSLWNFLLQSEIARAAALTITSRPHSIPKTDDELRLLRFIEDADFNIMDEFAVRFERAVAAIEVAGVGSVSSLGESRDLVNEALYSENIRVLRSRVGAVLKSRERVALLVDNLDKAWDRNVNLEAAAQLLLGLLAAEGHVSVEYQKEDFWRDRVALSLATFLRSDIYTYIQRVAREPDKITTSVVDWNESDLLLRVIEERFLAVRQGHSDASELWTRFFCPTVGNRPLKDYLTWRALPRPRDLVYLCNEATVVAVNARHEQVQEGDFLIAESSYSQFALEALLVENGITISELEDVLFEFAGEEAILPRSTALSIIKRVISEGMRSEEVLTHLEAISFLGLRVSNSRFSFPEVGPIRKRDLVLARKYAEERGLETQLIIHPAYRPYLEIRDPA